MQMVTHFYFFPIGKALENNEFWQQGVQIEPLAARTFFLSVENQNFYDFQMNPLSRNNLIV